MGNQEAPKKQFTEYVIRQGDTLSEIVEKFKKNTLFPHAHFEVEDSLSYQQVWDLEENKSPGYINSAKNKALYHKKPYDIYPGEKVKLPYINKIITLPLPYNVPVHLGLETGNKYFIKQPGFRLIIDAHMHIQSLNATPMPLQWGTAFKGLKEKASLLASSHVYKTRKDERDTTVAWYTRWLAVKDFGNIGQFSTDVIAKIFLGMAHNEDMKKKLYWLLGENPATSKLTEAEAGQKLKLGALADIRDKEQHDFTRTATYYFTGDDVTKMNIIMPMDLSFAHFWGNYGIPINLPNADGKTFSFINDYLHYTMKPFGEFAYERTFTIEYEPTIGSKNHFYFDIDLKKELDHFLYYMRGLYGIEEYLPPFERKTDVIYSFAYDNIRKIIEPYKKTILTENGAPHLPGKGLFESESDFERRRQNFRQELSRLQHELKPVLSTIQERYAKSLNKKFKHFLEPIPGDNTEMFEDYRQQTLYTEAAAFRAPLEMLGFYHYDPRRYYLDDTEKEKILSELETNHSFFTLPKKSAFITLNSYPQEMIDIREAEWDIRTYFKNIIDGVTIKDFRNVPRVVNMPELLPLAEVKKKIYPEGTFLGIKMYAPLGYPANIYKANDLARYQHLKELFKFCEKEKIPITVHGSPNGMTIPDGLNYLRYDMKYYNQRINKNNVDINDFLGGKAADKENRQYEILKAVDYLDYICNRPSVWQDVLSDYPDLKLCLAHFGSMDTWEKGAAEPAAAETSFDWRGKIIELIKNNNNLYTDISCYVMEEKPPILLLSDFEKITDSNKKRIVINSYVAAPSGLSEPLYSPSPFLSVKEEMQVMLILHEYDLFSPKDKINTIAKNMAAALANDRGDKLKERIMMGSDWYMSEMGARGTGIYYHNMFKLLAEITKKIGNKYDVWHQFAVINPLNFLGLLQADGSGKPVTDTFNGKKIYLLNEEKINTYIGNLRKLPGQTKNIWQRKAEVVDDEINNFEIKAEDKFLFLKKKLNLKQHRTFTRPRDNPRLCKMNIILPLKTPLLQCALSPALF
jgi:hypothetical protein